MRLQDPTTKISALRFQWAQDGHPLGETMDRLSSRDGDLLAKMVLRHWRRVWPALGEGVDGVQALYAVASSHGAGGIDRSGYNLALRCWSARSLGRVEQLNALANYLGASRFLYRNVSIDGWEDPDLPHSSLSRLRPAETIIFAPRVDIEAQKIALAHDVTRRDDVLSLAAASDTVDLWVRQRRPLYDAGDPYDFIGREFVAAKYHGEGAAESSGAELALLVCEYGAGLSDYSPGLPDAHVRLCGITSFLASRGEQ